jgi:hypothetical protein
MPSLIMVPGHGKPVGRDVLEMDHFVNLWIPKKWPRVVEPLRCFCSIENM